MKSILGILGIIAGTMLIATVLQNTAYAETDLSNWQNRIAKRDTQNKLIMHRTHLHNLI